MISTRSSRTVRGAAALWLVSLSCLVLSAPTAAANTGDPGRIAFVGNQGGSFQLYTMDPDGNRMVQITNLPSTPFETWVPAFSPDGRRLTFCYGNVTSGGNLITEIYVMDVDGSGLKRVTNDGLFDCFPRWSPDGSMIIFARLSPVTFQSVVTTMRPDGSNMTPLTTPLWSGLRSGFTSDGRHVVWETQQAGFVSAVWSMDADGKHQRLLTAPPLKAGEISAPSSDGKHLVFIDNQNMPLALSNVLYGMNLDGSGIRRLTQAVGTSHDVFPNFSPYGNKIVFASDRMSSDGSLDLFTMNVDGTNLRRIVTGITVGGCADKGCVTPAWGRKPGGIVLNSP